jgi:hypothetical protein
MVEKPRVTIVATGGTAHTVIHFILLTTGVLQAYLQELDYHIAYRCEKLWTSNRNG